MEWVQCRVEMVQYFSDFYVEIQLYKNNGLNDSTSIVSDLSFTAKWVLQQD